MPKLNSYEAFKRDGILLEFMKSRKGKHNRVTSKEIADFLTSRGYDTRKECVNGLIKRILYERNAPICFSNARGYYWAQTREEIESTIADMESRIASLNEHIEHLRNFVIK